jgi:hypothetical protein
MKIKVISCEKPTWWYDDCIGQEFEVDQHPHDRSDYWCESVGSSLSKIDCEVVEDIVVSNGLNPKAQIGSYALPMGMISPLFAAHVALGKLNGAEKYGLANYIGTEVVMSIYLDAIQRHLDKIKMGEVVDEVDGVNHFGAIGANCDIILSAQAAGTLIDDRPLSTGQLEAYKALTPMVKQLKELHKEKNPKDYYAKDSK